MAYAEMKPDASAVLARETVKVLRLTRAHANRHTIWRYNHTVANQSAFTCWASGSHHASCHTGTTAQHWMIVQA